MGDMTPSGTVYRKGGPLEIKFANNPRKYCLLSPNYWEISAPVMEFRKISWGLKSQDLVCQTGSLV
jgi:hypothetical protein